MCGQRSCLVFFLMLSVPAGSAHVCMDRRDVISGKGLP